MQAGLAGPQFASRGAEAEMKHSKLTAPLILFALTITSTLANVVPGRWDKVANLVPGTQIIVEMQSGDSIRGGFVSVDDQSLAIDAGINNRTSVPKSGVVRVLQEKKGKRQTLIGTSIGAAGGVLTGVLISSRSDETFFARADLMALTCGGIGALAGALIGHSIDGDNREEVIFRSR
jgi:hypothetical protein